MQPKLMKNKHPYFPHLLLKPGKIKDQFYLALKKIIQSGELMPGTKLPSSRSFAALMSISRNSVLVGIDRLMDEGYLITQHGAGTFIADILPDQLINLPQQQQQQQPLERKAIDAHLALKTELKINPNIENLGPIWHKTVRSTGKYALFSIGVGCTDVFPHHLWGRLLGRTWRQFSTQMGLHNDPFGFFPLRQSICDYVRTTRGLNCSPDQILMVSGTQQAMNLTAQVLLQQGDEIWLDEPGYDGALGAFTAMGAKVCPVLSDQDGMDISYGIQHWPNAKMIFTAPSHQFPLGGTLSLARRLALLDWAAKKQVWIFEDDYNSEFRYKAQPIQALQGLDTQQRVIYAGTFSKMMFPELRLGFMVLPTALINAFKLAKYYADTRTAYLEQAALAMFIAQGHYARHVRRVRKACHERQLALVNAIEKYLPQQLSVAVADSGIHLVCYLAQHLNEHEVIEKCRSIGLGAQPLTRYCQNPNPNPAILIGFAAHSPAEIEMGIQQLAQALV